MKKLFLMLSLILTSITMQASHLLGGFINTIQHGYSDTVTVYVTLFSDPQGIGNPNSLVLNDLIKVNGFYQSSSNITLSQQSTGTWQGVNTAVYSTVTTLTAGEHRLIYTNCCRGMLSNASSSMNSNFTISLDYTKTASGTIPNSAPFIANYLPIKWVNGVQSQSMIFTFDLDGDSIFIEMDDAINQHSNNTFVPLSPFTQLTSYGSYNVGTNGLIKWTPNTLGQYGTGFKVSEYRNGTLIGVNRIQQVFQVETGSTPQISAPFNMTINSDSTVTITHDLLNGDSTYVGFTASNYQNAQLVIIGATINKASNTTWSITDLNTSGTYKGYLRVYSLNSNMDFPVNLVVNSTIGVEELNKPSFYQIYDIYGNLFYEGEDIPYNYMKGLYIIRNGYKTEKVYVIQ